jgi:surfeit locus 1 family protein
MWRLARTPRWLAALAFALALATAFVLLSQWQLSRSVSRETVEIRDTEDPVPIGSVAKPQRAVTTTASGQMVTASGNYVGGDFQVLSGRENFGKTGYWLVGHLVDFSGGADGPSLAVALGWSASKSGATSAIEGLESRSSEEQVIGRYLPSEQPVEDDFEHGERKSMSVASLINEWAGAPSGVYGGFLIARDAPAGLAKIDSPRPTATVTLNWLNLVYAVEWVVFAVLAIVLWFRLLRDAWERDRDEKAELN